MSRIGKLPISIPSGVTVEQKDHTLTIKGPKGELTRAFHPNMIIELGENEVVVKTPDQKKENKSLHGLTRTLIANMVLGVTKGYEKKLEVVGIGYRFTTNKNKISLTLGYSHPVEFTAPNGIEFKADEALKNTIVVSGIDKEVVGEVAAKVRAFRKPEPYKGKGIKYLDEHITRKAGKTAAK